MSRRYRQGWLEWCKRRLPALWLACLLGCLVASGAHAQSNAAESFPATLEDYTAALQSARQILASETNAETNAETALEQARAELAPIRQVLLPSGVQVEVEPLLGESGPLAAGDALARVETALAQLEAADSDDTDARLAVLADVLAGPQFVAGESWFEQFLRWLAEWWERIAPDAPSSPGAAAVGEAANDTLWIGIGVAGAIALVLLLAYWLRGFLGNFIGSAEVTAANGAPDDLPQTPAEARRRAADRAAGGDFRAAVRNLYLSALLTLEQNGLVPADRSLTNRELLGRVQANHPVRPHLQPVVETFDDVWYGVHEPDNETYTAYTRSIDELEALTQRQAKEAQP
jgi:hypothetical protein